MARDNGQGMFTMPEITAICNMHDLGQAKAAALAVVKASTANDANKAKANAMINKSTTITKLGLGMSNFNLAHQGLGTL